MIADEPRPRFSCRNAVNSLHLKQKRCNWTGRQDRTATTDSEMVVHQKIREQEHGGVIGCEAVRTSGGVRRSQRSTRKVNQL